MLTTVASLRSFFDYVRWADLLQLEAAGALSDDAYFKDHGFSFRSVHGVLLHMISAQNVWRQRFTGEANVWLAGLPELQRDRAAVGPLWRDVHSRMVDYLASIADVDLQRVVHFRRLSGDPMQGRLGALLIHTLNHAMHHRGQLSSMIVLSGGKSPAVDYMLWDGNPPAQA